MAPTSCGHQEKKQTSSSSEQTGQWDKSTSTHILKLKFGSQINDASIHDIVQSETENTGSNVDKMEGNAFQNILCTFCTHSVFVI